MNRRWELRPARDHGLSPAERLRSIAREPGLGGRTTVAAWRGLVAAYLRLFHRLEVEGRANLPGEPPFVMVANHASHLDALVLAVSLPRRLGGRAFALAAGDTFFTAGAKAAFAAYAVNALPVWRAKTSARDLRELRQRLHEDRSILILFPEGTRTRTGEMARFKPGIGALVAGTAVPVVPCYLAGAFAAWPPHRRLPRPGKLVLSIGTPLVFADAGKDRAGLNAVSAACEDAVRRLAPVSASAG
ncbi:MAG: 1-acyl-sn-glycerol-3-phosphate acyltransferase [Acetobacteraceae bacterium]|nr:1-acyl-sn-glycerol-3-phosphate acyltransferase [Acetobacteraceae bacterium]